MKQKSYTTEKERMIEVALKTLRGIKTIGGVETCELEKTAATKPHEFIIVNHEVNSISFTLQNGPVKENGVNGCQVDQIVQAALLIISGLNKQFPCRENSIAITKLQEALMWLDERKKDRELRGVEGYYKK